MLDHREQNGRMAEDAGDVATALELIRPGEKRPRSLDEITAVIERADPMDVWHRCATFLYAWLQKCPPEAPPASVRKLRKEGLFPEPTLAAIGAGLRAAIRRETPATWRPGHL